MKRKNKANHVCPTNYAIQRQAFHRTAQAAAKKAARNIAAIGRTPLDSIIGTSLHSPKKPFLKYPTDRLILKRKKLNEVKQLPNTPAVDSLRRLLTVCGSKARGTVLFQRSKYGSKEHGINQCKSEFCPNCAPVKEAQRRWKMERYLSQFHALGQLKERSVFTGAFTISHSKADDPKETERILTVVLQGLQRTAPWKRTVWKFFVRVECTASKGSGLHIHLQWFAILNGTDEAQHRALWDHAESYFKQHAQLHGRKAGGYAWHPIKDGRQSHFANKVASGDEGNALRYILKASLEVTESNGKNGGLWSMPAQDLADYAFAMKNTRLWRPPQGCKLEDDSEEKPNEFQDVLAIPAETWNQLTHISQEVIRTVNRDLRFPVEAVQALAAMLQPGLSKQDVETGLKAYFADLRQRFIPPS